MSCWCAAALLDLSPRSLPRECGEPKSLICMFRGSAAWPAPQLPADGPWRHLLHPHVLPGRGDQPGVQHILDLQVRGPGGAGKFRGRGSLMGSADREFGGGGEPAGQDSAGSASWEAGTPR